MYRHYPRRPDRVLGINGDQLVLFNSLVDVTHSHAQEHGDHVVQTAHDELVHACVCVCVPMQSDLRSCPNRLVRQRAPERCDTAPSPSTAVASRVCLIILYYNNRSSLTNIEYGGDPVHVCLCVSIDDGVTFRRLRRYAR